MNTLKHSLRLELPKIFPNFQVENFKDLKSYIVHARVLSQCECAKMFESLKVESFSNRFNMLSVFKKLLSTFTSETHTFARKTTVLLSGVKFTPKPTSCLFE